MFNICRLKEVMTVLDGVDVSQCRIMTNEVDDSLGDDDMSVRVAGVSNDLKIAVFCRTDTFIEKSMGILSVKGMLTRLSLFDETKVSVELVEEESDNRYAHSMKVKQGRKRTTIKTTRPKKIPAPTQDVSGDIMAIGYLDKAMIDYFSKVRSSINLSESGQEIMVELSFDEDTPQERMKVKFVGADDTFEDMIDGEIDSQYKGKSVKVNWTIDSWMRVMKKAAQLNDDETIQFTVYDVGVAEVMICDIPVWISPITVQAK